MISVEVARYAVCAADDQTKPLRLSIRAPGPESLEAFIARILSSNFLQFSSSHASMTGFASGQAIVRVHADFTFGHRPEFLISADTTIEVCLSNGLLEFMWADSNQSFQRNPI